MNLKKHYKLYKSGKLWVTAAITTLALTAGMAVTSTTNASADAAVTNEKVNLAGSASVDPGAGSSASSAASSSAKPGSDSNIVVLLQTLLKKWLILLPLLVKSTM